MTNPETQVFAKKKSEYKVGTKFARDTREIVKTQIDQNQEENAATEFKTGASVVRDV